MYLDKQQEVKAYTKVLTRMPLSIPYHDPEGYLRHYHPDFVVRTEDAFWLIETQRCRLGSHGHRRAESEGG
jgi:hypothetical protein